MPSTSGFYDSLFTSHPSFLPPSLGNEDVYMSTPLRQIMTDSDSLHMASSPTNDSTTAVEHRVKQYNINLAIRKLASQQELVEAFRTEHHSLENEFQVSVAISNSCKRASEIRAYRLPWPVPGTTPPSVTRIVPFFSTRSKGSRTNSASSKSSEPSLRPS